MILLPNDEKEIIYPAIAVMDKDFSIRNLYATYKIGASEFVLDFDETTIEKSYSSDGSFESSFRNGEIHAEHWIKSKWDGRMCEEIKLAYIHPLKLAYIKSFHMGARKNAEPYEYEMLDLFNKYEKLDVSRELEALKKAKELIETLSESSIDVETFKRSIQMMWPIFGYFATEIVDSMEFVPLEDAEVFTYGKINEKSELLDYCKRFGLSMEESREQEVLKIVNAKEKALYNEQVLSLARKVNERSRK